MTQNDALAAFLGPEIFNRLAWSRLNNEQREAILSVFRVGLNAGAASGSISMIEQLMAAGQVIFCEDGSRWRAMGRDDADLVSDWGEGALVAIHRNLIYRLDDYESVEVEPLRL
ncbi:MAG: hypothetical protein AB7L65_02050 [Hyphomonadaceae bacterium]